jgi:hypothetical protein
MSDYLRPKTLFAPENCVEYFDKAKKWEALGVLPGLTGNGLNKRQAFKSSYAMLITRCQRGSVHEQAISEMGWWEIYPAG